MLEQEFRYYVENKNSLLSSYLGKFVVIKNQQVVGSYDTEYEAYSRSVQEFEPGTFLIQHCLPGESDYKQTYHSRVFFSR